MTMETFNGILNVKYLSAVIHIDVTPILRYVIAISNVSIRRLVVNISYFNIVIFFCQLHYQNEINARYTGKHVIKRFIVHQVLIS